MPIHGVLVKGKELLWLQTHQIYIPKTQVLNFGEIWRQIRTLTRQLRTTSNYLDSTYIFI